MFLRGFVKNKIFIIHPKKAPRESQKFKFLGENIYPFYMSHRVDIVYTHLAVLICLFRNTAKTTKKFPVEPKMMRKQYMIRRQVKIGSEMFRFPSMSSKFFCSANEFGSSDEFIAVSIMLCFARIPITIDILLPGCFSNYFTK